jgi:two-component system sensor histidine kinase KdpD
VALMVFLAVSAVGGTLLAASRRSAREARQRQTQAEAVLALTRSLSGEIEPDAALRTLCRELTRVLDAPGVSVLSKAGAEWTVLAGAGRGDAMRMPDPDERAMAERAIASRETTGLGEGIDEHRRRRIVVPRGRDAALRQSRAIALVPLTLGTETRGVLRLDGPLGESPFRGNLEPLLSAVAGEAAVTIHRIELSRAAAQAEALSQADEMKTALMASISHDLKTPLAGIKAAISSLLDQRIQWSGEDVAAFYATIDAQSDRLNRVISDILDLNRIESGDLVPDQSSVSARDLLEAARDATAFEARGREVSIDVAPELHVVADRALITQALVNLIENAIKYSTAGGAIRLVAQPGAEGVAEIAVEDEGPGIPKEDLPFVFQRFYRAEGSRRIRGSGLGLTIVKGFVELCGGSVSVTSSEAGTRFVLTLPAELVAVAAS